MKKLMIAAAIVCASACVQAAPFNWQWVSSSSAVTAFDSAAPTAASDGTAYLIMGIPSSSIISDKAALLTALRAADPANYANIVKGNSYYQTDSARTLIDGAIEAYDFQTPTGGKQYSYTVIIDQAANGSYYAYFSAPAFDTGVDADGGTGAGKMTVALNGADVYNLDVTDNKFPGWYQLNAAGPGPIPEPTSGLLLLLGVAGLALRRRRA